MAIAKTEDYYYDLVFTEDFYDFTYVMFLVFGFTRIPTFLYDETDKCFYSLQSNKEFCETPFYVRLSLLPIDGSETDFKAIFEAGEFEHIGLYERIGWTSKFEMGYGFLRNGIWTNK